MTVQVKQATQNQVPSEFELLQRTKDLVPMLRKQAASVEESGTVPAQTIKAFRDAGLLRILQPKRWGGYGMSPLVFYKVLMEIGRGCPSSAWNLFVLGLHPWFFGLLDPKAGDEVWANDQNALVASSLAPFGQAKKVDGGWTLSGTWKFSSGCDHASGGTLLGARQMDDSGRMLDHLVFHVLPPDYEIVDDWHVVGLAGTGSKSIKVTEAFVPDYRVCSLIDYRGSDDPAYRYPLYQIFQGAVSAVIVGMAFGMIDIFIEQMTPRRNVFSEGSAAANPYVMERLGNAVLLVRSARARILQVMEESSFHVENGDLVPLEDRVKHLLELTRCGRDCLDATLMLWKKLGGRAIWLDNPAQLWMRAMLVAANHISQNEDDPAGFLGGYLLGQGVPPFVFDLPQV
ncbi:MULTISPECIES: acyl-CoA dehydrogenase family protein [Paraburkholderia]|uniref:acyl-CoA dehydrogenase family protein n=2 Tax=Paraburkholderia TaxID=1822464 RepID=UPI000B4913E8|nr:acyl-CoA dehydrogenase [Burkholderia sp. Bk]